MTGLVRTNQDDPFHHRRLAMLKAYLRIEYLLKLSSTSSYGNIGKEI
jgi:hypothetical protein